MKKLYRKNGLAVVFNQEGLVFMGARCDSETDSWQFPQGGMETGETPEETARRELQEETGIRHVELVATHSEPFFYDFPDEIIAKFRKIGRLNSGQEQYWSLFFFKGEDEIDFNAHPEEVEFKAYQWVKPEQAAELVVSWKKDTYQKGMAIFIPKIKEYLSGRAKK